MFRAIVGTYREREAHGYVRFGRRGCGNFVFWIFAAIFGGVEGSTAAWEFVVKRDLDTEKNSIRGVGRSVSKRRAASLKGARTKARMREARDAAIRVELPKEHGLKVYMPETTVRLKP